MKRLYVILVILITCLPVFGQENPEASLTDAKSAYGSGDLHATRAALEKALNELDIIIGHEILKVYPESFDNYKYKEEEDVVMGNSGGLTGLNVERKYYAGDDQYDYISILMMNNSPMMAMVNSFMTNPLFMNSADGSQKVVRVNGYKALLTKQDNGDGSFGYELQVPMGQSLLSLEFEKINNESKVLSYAETVDIKTIARLAGAN